MKFHARSPLDSKFIRFSLAFSLLMGLRADIDRSILFLTFIGEILFIALLFYLSRKTITAELINGRLLFNGLGRKIDIKVDQIQSFTKGVDFNYVNFTSHEGTDSSVIHVSKKDIDLLAHKINIEYNKLIEVINN